MTCIHCQLEVDNNINVCPECKKGDFLIGDALCTRKKDKITIKCSCGSDQLKIVKKSQEGHYYEEAYECQKCLKKFSIKRDMTKIVKKKRGKWLMGKKEI